MTRAQMDQGSVLSQSQDGDLRGGSASELPTSTKKWAPASIFLFFVGCTGTICGVGMTDFPKFVQPRAAKNVSLDTASNDAVLSISPKFYRSSFHFQPAKNWINDPNGPMFYKGCYHIFYQYNPGGATWGNLTWGHAVSEDLIHWLELEPALENDRWYDAGGVWSGSATIRPDGTPIILGTTGTALLYKGDDLVHWKLMKNVLRAIPETGMWGCLDFFPVASMGQHGLDTSVRGPSVKHVLKVSSLDSMRDYYAVGSYDVATEAFAPVNQDLDVIYGLQYDHGKFYASKSFYDPVKQRRINWGWANESDARAHDIAKGWASLLAMPRTVWLDSEFGDSLIQAPIDETKSLRGTKVSKSHVELEAGSVLRIEGSSGGQVS